MKRILLTFILVMLLTMTLASAALAAHGGPHVPPNSVINPGNACETQGKAGIKNAHGQGGNVRCKGGKKLPPVPKY